MNCVIVIIDGLGDRPIKEFKNKTPLEYANTPNLNKLASNGITGLMHPIKKGIIPGSDTSHFSIFGVDPEKYYSGRGPIEALGANIKIKNGDIAFRANLATVDSNLVLKDRRAGRIDSTKEFCEALDGMNIDGVEIIVKPSSWYRAVVVLRGNGLSDKISSTDPKLTGCRILDSKSINSTKEAKKTADIINKFVLFSYEKLKDLKINKERESKGLLPGNILLPRGAGKFNKIPTLKERYGISSACVAGGGLYKGVGRYLGMDVIEVEGATGRYDSDYDAKVSAVNKATKEYNLVFLHMKAIDSAGEDGNPRLKKELIEKVDRAISKLQSELILVTGDHSTPCELKRHSYEPVPILICGSGIRTDGVKKFGERSCMQGGLGHITGLDVMSILMSHAGFSSLYGS